MAFRVVGGPADGLRVASATGCFRWIDPRRRRGYRDPGDGRALYVKTGLGWEFAGAGSWACRCGAYMRELTERCPLCGSQRKGGS